MRKWKPSRSAPAEIKPDENPSRPLDRPWGRRWDLERDDGKTASITFEADLDAAIQFDEDPSQLPPEVAQAFETDGLSALERFLDDEEPPRHVLIQPDGLFPEY